MATIATKDALTSLRSVDVYPDIVETDSEATVLRFSHIDLDRIVKVLEAFADCGDDWDDDWDDDDGGDEEVVCGNCEELEDMLGDIRAILG